MRIDYWKNYYHNCIESGGGGLFDLVKRITSSKNTIVRDRVDLSVVQVYKSLSTVFNLLVGESMKLKVTPAAQGQRQYELPQ